MNQSTNSFSTRSQKLAQVAFQQVNQRKGNGETEYKRFAKKFPSLIHTCGLVQSLAFALAKKQGDLVDDLATVLALKDREELALQSRSADVTAYIRLSRQALEAAGWLKRYAEAILKGDD